MGVGLALVIAIGGLDLGLLDIALVTRLVDLAVSDVGLHAARHGVVFDSARVWLELYVWRESESWSIAH